MPHLSPAHASNAIASNAPTHPACAAFALAAALAVFAHPAAATISQSTLIPPGGYVQAACYSISNGLVVPGGDLGSTSMIQDFEEHAFAGNSSAAASAAFNGPPTVNSVTASAGLGVFRALAVNSTISTESFPAAAANGGWKETFA